MESASFALVRVGESEDDFAFALVGWSDVGHETSRASHQRPTTVDPMFVAEVREPIAPPKAAAYKNSVKRLSRLPNLSSCPILETHARFMTVAYHSGVGLLSSCSVLSPKGDSQQLTCSQPKQYFGQAFRRHGLQVLFSLGLMVGV